MPMTRSDMANYLRLAPETVSRVLRRLQDLEIIAVDRRIFALLQYDALARMAKPVLRD